MLTLPRLMCRPDADVLVPVFSPYSRGGIVSPFSGERNISLLMRFDYPLTDGKSLVAHHGHRIRKELMDYWEDNKLEGSDLGLRSTKVNSPWSETDAIGDAHDRCKLIFWTTGEMLSITAPACLQRAPEALPLCEV